MKNICIKTIFAILILCIMSIIFITNGASFQIGNISPSINNIIVENITDTSADITFRVDQIDARTIVHYGNDSVSLNKRSGWNNVVSMVRTITLSGLSKGKMYYYAVYSQNKSDPNSSSHSETLSFNTTGDPLPDAIAPNVTNVVVESVGISTANITFLVDQMDARAIIHYGKTTSFGKLSNWSNDTSLTRKITLTDLLEGTYYNFSVYVYNGSNGNSSHSSTETFRTVGTAILNGTAPNIINSSIAVDGITSSTVNITFLVDQQDARTRINYGTDGKFDKLSDWNNDTSLSRRIMLHDLLNTTDYNFSIRAYNGTNESYYKDSVIGNFTTRNVSIPPVSKIVPTISLKTPEKSKRTTAKIPVNFTVSFSDIVNVTWRLNDTEVKTEKLVQFSYYVNNAAVVGVYNVTVEGSNDNGSVSYSWNLTVDPEVFGTGNRIWDGSKAMSTTYMWNSFSFAGFYYDIDTNMSTEELIIKNIKRSIDIRDITYRSSPQEVNFGYSNFGKYQVIGFMANKYFAGYKNSTIPGPTSSFGDISTMSQGQLHKVLIDDDSKRTISVGGTIALQDGYILKATDIDLGARTMLLSLLKDGKEVDSSPLAKDGTYVYRKRVGNVESLPLILVRFDNVFSGTELQVAFLKGIFQISDTPTSVKVGDSYGRMEVSEVNGNNITMENRNTVGLSQGSKIDLMGDLKIIVADDSNTLRFALSVERKGAFEVRGTIYPVTNLWTPMNFGLNVGDANIGFYYDLDEDIGTESLRISSISGYSIPANGLTYSTSAQQVSFAYSNFGKYQVVGFMADKYFAGYSGGTISRPTSSFSDISALSQGQLHKVLIDDDTKRTISVGGTMALKDGYVLKATDIDLGARTMLLSLLKDGKEVDVSPLSKDETYVYRKRIGNVEDLPLILVRFDNVFSGNELQAAFLKGVFQISDTPTYVKIGDSFGNMEVRTISKFALTMTNDASIGLSRDNTVDIMGNIKFKVADSGDLRFYPFVSVTPDMVGIVLSLNIPSRATGGDTIHINVTAGGVPIEGASVVIDPETGLTSKNTNADGTASFTFPKRSKGTYKVTVAKLGYESANKTIEVQQYIEGSLSIDIPAIIDQFQNVPMKITSNGTAINNTTVIYDNKTIGTTDNNGVLSYTFGESGTHTISVTKVGYVGVSRDIDVRAPYSDFRAQDINIVPDKVFTEDTVAIRSNITNSGTKGDTKSIQLIINGTTVDNVSIMLNPKETKEINFTHVISLPEGNYTIEILEQVKLVEIQKKKTSIIQTVIIATIVGMIAIYVGTSRKGKDVISRLISRLIRR